MMDLCFYILLHMSILDGYRDFNRKKYIESKKSAIVIAMCMNRVLLLPSFPILKGS